MIFWEIVHFIKVFKCIDIKLFKLFFLYFFFQPINIFPLRSNSVYFYLLSLFPPNASYEKFVKFIGLSKEAIFGFVELYCFYVFHFINFLKK